MRMGEALLTEFDNEMATTRRILERVPSEKATWKPHPKSFALGHLAQLLSWMPSWIANGIKEDSLDLMMAPGYSFETTETLIKVFDANVREAREALEKAEDDDFGKLWSLRRGEQIYMSAPRGAVVRMHISHLSHHRGQMTVYLRLLDIPVPSVYGPTADERMG